uniref:Putative reverse transcriptase n=1 Tax=Anopheles darlingi TaxID=43151 RepID=A0A2M4CJ33_ANODA
MRKSRMAQDLMIQAVQNVGAQVALLSEVNHIPPKNNSWVADSSGRVAVYACGDRPVQKALRTGMEGLAAAVIDGTLFFSCYAHPRMAIADFQRFLTVIITLARGHPRVVVGGDLNAWAEAWGSRTSSNKGIEVLEMAEQLGLTLLNRGNIPTFNGGRRTTPSFIDVSFATRGIAEDKDWRVLDGFTNSDHEAILFHILPRQHRRPTNGEQEDPSTHNIQRWATKFFDKEAFVVALQVVKIGEARTAEEITAKLMEACDEIMPRYRGHGTRRRKPAYFWNDQIEALKWVCKSCQKEFRRHRNDPDEAVADLLADVLKQAKKLMKRAIQKSKNEGLKLLADTVEDNPYGDAFRLSMSWLRGNRAAPETDPAETRRLVDELFPKHPPMEWPQPSAASSNSSTPNVLRQVTQEELRNIARRLGPRKAPGPDGIPNIAVAMAIMENTEVFQRIFQQLLDQQTFPTQWKVQRLVLIPKPGKPPGNGSSYRPLCMINTLGKVYEKILLNRLNEELEDATTGPKLSASQFGFRKQRSTVDAVEQVVARASYAIQFGVTNKKDMRCLMAVALDVKNAFNNASWTSIGRALLEKRVSGPLINILGDYFRDRQLIYRTNEGVETRAVTAGVPQGSILGPTLWNTMYDGVLRLDLPGGATVTGFADDILICAPGRKPEEARDTAQAAVAIVQNWMTQHKLEIAPEKTEAIMFSSIKRGKQHVSYKVGTVELTTKKELKYLGVILNDHLRWKGHIEAAAAKATRMSNALGYIMRNHGGPSCFRRRILANVALSTLRYASPIWAAAALETGAMRRIVNAVQGRAAKGVASSFRTVSHRAASLIAGMPPICLLLEEDLRVRERKLAEPDTAVGIIRKEERLTTITLWQGEWDEDGNNPASSRYIRWAHRIIPDMDAWTARKHGRLTFQLAQMLSGHGFFREFMHIKHLADSEFCPSCPTRVENAEHILFECPRFNGERQALLAFEEGALTPDNLLSNLLHSEDRWSSISAVVKRIMDELQRQWQEYTQIPPDAGSWNAELEAAAAARQEAQRLRKNERQREANARRRQRGANEEQQA